MKYKRIDSLLFSDNRRKFVRQLKPSSLAVFNSNDIYPVSGDSTLPFHQHRDIFYLSGIDQEESILVIFPDAFDERHREVLFLKETNDHIRVWEGEKLTKEAAFEVSGIRTVYWIHEFDTVFRQLMTQAANVYLNTNEHLRAATTVETREGRFVRWCRKNYPLHTYLRCAPLMHSLRAIKHPLETALMQTACNITGKGFRRVLGFMKPGVWEYEIEAELLHEFVRNRSRGFAYTPIIASGKNACVLHYIENHAQCREGEVVLMDFGAEYANYSSDLTRCVPVNGRFTERQRAVYNAVLAVKNEATRLLVPGTYLKDYHAEVGKIMERELLSLRLLDRNDIKNQHPDKPAYKKYFMHGTSHFIGLDTHDSGLWTEPVKSGMAFTVEPGIYIPDEGLGIRLEDDVIVQETGDPVNLMKDIPIEAEEIEELMSKRVEVA